MDTDAPMSPDWVFSNTSNVSVAKNRAWFTTYTSFTTHIGHPYFDNSDMAGPIEDHEGRIAAHFDEKKTLLCLKLSGPPVGLVTSPSLFLKETRDPGNVYTIGAYWPDSERARWEAVKPYTSEEKAWLKEHYGGEYHFLQEQDLSMHKDEDREEGRSLARSIMANGDSDDDQEEDDDSNSFLDELEADPMSHVADYQFSQEQLDWIKKHYQHSGNFLLSYGLKPFDDEDCSEGKAILNALMNEDD
ncbi:hypothetical protein NA57DRAFT_79508 [Rhizodiscina lignyota]|uniref:Uncharacterized protein n=1 Tax=Rhizodiscina lignyota TaxID=1504668 RepID=A0A9P4I8U7_9PEZI|nr:hypothetical protein NA57DRAFT_79508 [Rhizodiscina lignyota]